jgi:hypothetical protein
MLLSGTRNWRQGHDGEVAGAREHVPDADGQQADPWVGARQEDAEGPQEDAAHGRPEERQRPHQPARRPPDAARRAQEADEEHESRGQLPDPDDEGSRSDLRGSRAGGHQRDGTTGGERPPDMAAHAGAWLHGRFGLLGGEAPA